MARWLPLFAISFALGIAAEDVIGASRQAWRPLAVVPLLIGAAARGSPRARGLAAAVACFASGAGLLAGEFERAARHSPDGPRDVEVEAWVCSDPLGPATWVSLDLCGATAVVGSAQDGPVPQRIRVSGNSDDTTEATLRRLQHGTRVRAGLRLRATDGPANPGSASLARALARRGVGARGRLRHPDLLVEIADDPPGEPGRPDLRRQLVNALVARGEGGALLAALALGEATAVPPARRAQFARLGIAHVLAVSGLHLALVGALAYALAFWLVRVAMRAPWLARAGLAGRDGRTGAALVGTGLTLGYALVSGGRAPVQRAAMLLVAALLARFVGRGRSLAPALAAAGIAVLALEPGALFRPGTQLSFAACAGLMAAKPAPRLAPGRWLGVQGLIRAGAVATASTAPILAAHGMVVAPWGLLANLAAIPWTAFVLLPSAFVAVACAAFDWSGAIELCVRLAHGTLRTAGVLAAVFAPDAAPAIGLAPPAAWALALSVALTLGTLRTAGTARRLLLAWLTCLWCLYAPRPALGPPAPRLVAFDVGQGDSLLVQGRRGSMLVDGGLARPGGLDRGERVVVPGLRALGIQRLDVVIASHADLDHRGGLEAVLGHISVGELWLPLSALGDADFEGLRTLARGRGALVRGLARREGVERVGDLAVEVLWPPEGRMPGWSRNDRSLVVRVRAGDGPRVLLTGDAGQRVERALLELGGAIDAEVLKVGHHGSRTASGGAFLSTVGASVALLSAGCHSRGLPAGLTLERLRTARSSVWWTGRDGALWLRLVHPLSAWGERTRPRRCGKPRKPRSGRRAPGTGPGLEWPGFARRDRSEHWDHFSLGVRDLARNNPPIRPPERGTLRRAATTDAWRSRSGRT